ncbi:MAG: phosphodiester glycosidase family protein [Candidatus Cryptobacteroides sp.]|nr:phosphodiester glycosidase family protein [Candidatus Cryptobacteroides sp.]
MKRFYLLFLLLAVLACNKTAPITSLPAPEQVSARLQGEQQILLEWKHAGAEGFYILQYGVTQPLAKLPAGSSSFLSGEYAPGSTVQLGVQAFSDSRISTIAYAAAVTLPKKEEPVEPEEDDPIDPVTFSWDEVTGTELPSSVRIFKTEGTLNGRPLQAWYAAAKTDADVKLRVLFPGLDNKQTIDAQAESEEKCLVLINGGIFGRLNNGLAVCDGQQTPWARVEDDNWDVDRQYWGPDSKLHTVSRGLFGVDQDGVPGVFWSYTPSHGTVYVYDQPIPTVAGGPVQPGGTDTFPCERVQWTPYNAITCGPVLLQNGKCPINKNKTAAGYWETNYELWADDIYGVDVLADRTAVGYLEDGSTVLCIVDGRIDTSNGATTLEMAAIMKGLGCVGALNLDGGGSTGMWVKGKGHLNDLTGGNRAVLTTIGFFTK